MKILLASFFPLPHQGGIWTYVDLLRKGLEERGHTVEILSRHPKEPAYYLMKQNRSVQREIFLELLRHQVKRTLRKNVPKAELYRSFDGNWSVLDMDVERYAFEIAAAYLGLKEYDLLHAQDVLSSRALARVKPEETPLVTTLHGVLAYELLERGAYVKQSTAWNYAYAQEYFGATSAAHLIVPTQSMKNMLLKDFHFDPQRMSVIPHGMELQSFRQEMNLQTAVTRPAGKKVIICPARLDPVKGHQYLFEALAKLKKVRSDWHCWLVGEGERERKESLRRHCESLGLMDDVSYLGYRRDVPALLKQSDLFVLPSLMENQPFAVMEAQAAGLPIIATHVGGVAEMIVAEETGILVPPGDRDALYRQLNRLLSDDDLCSRLKVGALEAAGQKWDARRMVDSTWQLYENVRKSQRGGGTET